VKDVVVNLDDLIGYIRTDRVRRQTSGVDNTLSFHLYRTDSDQSSSQSNYQFIHLQSILHCLFNLHSTNQNDFIQYYREFSKGNENDLTLINQFNKSYTADRALQCYLQNTCISRLLTKALETVNIDQLFFFRFLLSDLQFQLDQCRCTSFIRTYRQQLLSKMNIQQIQGTIGGFISINSCLITNTQREKVIGSSNETTNGHQQVLFEIDADPQLPGIRPIVSLKSFHLSMDQNEILFMTGSVFRIDGVSSPSDSSMTIIRLTLSRPDDIKLNVFNLALNSTIGNANDNDLIAYADVLLQIGKFDESEKYYQRALNELTNERYDELARCYYGLGIITMDKDKDDLSFEYHQKSLKIKKDLFDDQHVTLAESYYSLADLYRKKGNRNTALEFYNRALIILKNQNISEWAYKIAMCLNNVGCLYSEEKDYQKTSEYYQEALKILQEYCPSNHCYLGQTYNNMGSTYRALGDYQNAIKYYKLSLEIKSKLLSSQNLSIASTLSNIAGVYEEINDYKQALLFYERAAAIYRQRLPPTHPDYLRVQRDVRRLSNKLKS